MRDLNVALALIGGLTLLFGLLAGLFRSRAEVLSEPLVATLVGAVAGPLGLGLLDMSDWGTSEAILEQVARLTIAFAVMAAALRLPPDFLARRRRVLALLLGLGMLLMWAASTLLIWAILGLSPLLAALVGAVLTPTDPVLAGTTVTGREAREHLPARLRNTLSAEAGANDGLAIPFVLLPILLLQHPPGAALQDWVLVGVGRHVLLAIVLGLITGWGAARVQRWSEGRPWAEEMDLLTVTLALTAAVLGGAALIGSEGILAVFVAGLTFRRTVFPDREEEEQEHVQEALRRVLTFPAFVLFGLALPLREWGAYGAAAIWLALAVLLLRRIPALLLLRRRLDTLHGRADAWFAGWFGPVGVAAIYYATMAARTTPSQEPWVLGSLVVAASILAHGVSATPLTRLYGRRAGR